MAYYDAPLARARSPMQSPRGYDNGYESPRYCEGRERRSHRHERGHHHRSQSAGPAMAAAYCESIYNGRDTRYDRGSSLLEQMLALGQRALEEQRAMQQELQQLRAMVGGDRVSRARSMPPAERVASRSVPSMEVMDMSKDAVSTNHVTNGYSGHGEAGWSYGQSMQDLIAKVSAQMDRMERQMMGSMPWSQPAMVNNESVPHYTAPPEAHRKPDGTKTEATMMESKREKSAAESFAQERLHSIIALSDEDEHAEERRRKRDQMGDGKGLHKYMTWLQHLVVRGVEDDDDHIDVLMAIVIVLYGISVGVSSDHWREWNGWILIELVFTVLFCLEIFGKMYFLGFRHQYMGRDKMINIFDSTLVLTDVVQLIAGARLITAANPTAMSFSAKTFRLMRLAKLARVLRLLRIGYFKELVTMVDGMMGGFHTLVMACIVFCVPFYTCAMLMRETLGQPDPDAVVPEDDLATAEEMLELFGTVPKALFTMSRCGLGDCSTAGGQPLFELVERWHGWPWGIFALAFNVIVGIGLMNVIAAIFVDSVVSTTVATEKTEKSTRLANQHLTAQKLTQIVHCLVTRVLADKNDHRDLNLLENFQEVKSMEITMELFNTVLKDDPRVRQALLDLDIGTDDHQGLFDILDSDNGGSLKFDELTSGIERLRGDPRRSDIVSVDLMLRSVQQNVNEILAQMKSLRRSSRDHPI